MPRGPQGQKRPADVIGNAVLIAKIATGEAEDTRYEQPAKARSGRAGAGSCGVIDGRGAQRHRKEGRCGSVELIR